MPVSISTGNKKSQPQIFPREIPLRVNALVKCRMRNLPKPRPDDPPEIFLGAWLKTFEIGPTEAAKIAGCTQSYISNISAGKKPNINVLYLLRLSEAMGVTINDFYRKPPTVTQLAPLADLSAAARTAIVTRKQRRA